MSRCDTSPAGSYLRGEVEHIDQISEHLGTCAECREVLARAAAMFGIAAEIQAWDAQDAAEIRAGRTPTAEEIALAEVLEEGEALRQAVEEWQTQNPVPGPETEGPSVRERLAALLGKLREAGRILDRVAYDLHAVDLWRDSKVEFATGGTGQIKSDRRPSEDDLFEAAVWLIRLEPDGSARYGVSVTFERDPGCPLRCICLVRARGEAEPVDALEISISQQAGAALGGRREILIPASVSAPVLEVFAAQVTSEELGPMTPTDAGMDLPRQALQNGYLLGLKEQNELFAARCFGERMRLHLETRSDADLHPEDLDLVQAVLSACEDPSEKTWPAGLIGILYYTGPSERPCYTWGLLAVDSSSRDPSTLVLRRPHHLDEPPRPPLLAGTVPDGHGGLAANAELFRLGFDGFERVVFTVAGYNGTRIRENSTSGAALSVLLGLAMEKRTPPVFVVGEVCSRNQGREWQLGPVDPGHLEGKLTQVPPWAQRVIVPRANKATALDCETGRLLHEKQKLCFVESFEDLVEALWGERQVAATAHPTTLTSALFKPLDPRPAPLAPLSSGAKDPLRYQKALVALAGLFAVLAGLEVPLLQEYLCEHQFVAGERGPLWHGVGAATVCALALGALTVFATRRLWRTALAGHFVRFHRVWGGALIGWMALLLLCAWPVWGHAETTEGARWFQTAKAGFVLASQLGLTIVSPLLHLALLESYRKQGRTFAVRTLLTTRFSPFALGISPFTGAFEVAILCIVCIGPLISMQWGALARGRQNQWAWMVTHIVVQAVVVQILVAAVTVVLLALEGHRIRAAATSLLAE